MSDDCKHNHHNCNVSSVNSNLYQTLDELDFERGIWYAAQYGDLERIEKLLQQETHVDVRDSSGYTALHYAARNGHKEVCQFLVGHRADINAVTKSGLATPLHRAASAGKIEIVKFLLENNAQVDLKDTDGKTALHRAAEIQDESICKIILFFCQDLKNEADKKGKIPADYAVPDTLKILLST